MKSAKRILAIVMAMLMVIGTCAVAASAASSLQNAIDAAGSSYTMSGKSVGSIVIDGKNDFTLDLNGYELVSDYGAPAITIKNSTNVTVKNGQVFSRFANVKSEDMLRMLKNGESPSAIVVEGGSVVLQGLRVDAGRTRIPTTREWFVPTGSAIQAYGNAKVTLKQVSAVGDYAVYNSAATVTVEDAILVGYMAAVLKAGNVVAAEGTEEKVNAADRIAGYLNSGVKLTAKEKEMVKKIFGQRVIIYTKSVETEAPVTVTNGTTVDVEATAISYIWENGAGGLGTDCSYKYIPEYLVLENGTRYALVAEGDKYTAHVTGESNVTENAQISYRLEFALEKDIQKYIAAYDNLDEYYTKVINKAKALWDSSNKDAQDFMGAYTYYTRQAREAFQYLLDTADDLYDQTNGNVNLWDNDSFVNLVRALVAIGGGVVNKDYLVGDQIPGVNRLSGSAYKTLFGTTQGATTPTAYKDPATGAYYYDVDAVPAGMQPLFVYGTLDKIALLVADMDAYMANIDDESTWANIAYWGYVNYENVLGFIPELKEEIAAVKSAVNSLGGEGLVDQIATIKDKLSLLDDADSLLGSAQTAVNEVLSSSTVQYILDTVDSKSEAQLKGYVNKVIRMYHNRDDYFTKENFVLEDGTVGKGYSVYGPIDLTEINGNVKIKVTIDGAADIDTKVTVALDGASEGVVSGTTYYFDTTATLTAIAAGNDEFLYWVNTETDRILSTESTLTFNTKIDRNIKAVFVSTEDEDGFENALATFTNNSGAITGSFAFEPDGSSINYEGLITKEPYLPGYTFSNWGFAENGAIDLEAAQANSDNKYLTGNSVFATMDQYYDYKGYALPVHDGSESYIVMPAFTLSNSTAHITFVDKKANTQYNADLKYGYSVTVNATDDPSFSYWADAKTGEIVCLNKTFTYQSIANRTPENAANFVAVYNGPSSEIFASRIAVVAKESDKVTLYTTRTIKSGYSFNTNGVVFSFTNAKPEVNAEGTFKGTSKSNAANGTYIVALANSTITGSASGVVYARPYVEINGVTYYGKTVTISL